MTTTAATAAPSAVTGRAGLVTLAGAGTQPRSSSSSAAGAGRVHHGVPGHHAGDLRRRSSRADLAGGRDVHPVLRDRHDRLRADGDRLPGPGDPDPDRARPRRAQAAPRHADAALGLLRRQGRHGPRRSAIAETVLLLAVARGVLRHRPAEHRREVADPALGEPARHHRLHAAAASRSPRCRAPGARAPAVVTPVALVLQFISGVFFVFTELPPWMQQVAALFPLKWMCQGMRSVFLPDSFAAQEAAGVLGAGPGRARPRRRGASAG